ncbi:uncharacterized protein B0H64DRAFT_393181 [Chaetomium fimeti]|uniref:DUF7735 domain-containing protein n=1 Tax=Chaetomium fimeti TaxID=1854472 RepID=A0AAE0HLH1_9PEZI|nr:hypothetical protein B0H64DRAFT_393181 [Chaetomium fimeti]
MRSNIVVGGLAALVATAAGVSARFLHDSPSATALNPLLVERQATTTAAVRPSLTPDPWQCITENITQYFDVPMPTGALSKAHESYAEELAAPCLATATRGRDMVSCLDSDPKSWCGLTTAAPASVLPDLSTYLSQVVSFWTANSETISILSTSCPVAWERQIPMIEHEWLKRVSAHASCYLEAHGAHPQTQTDATAPTPTAASGATTTTTPTTTTTTREGDASRRVQALEAFSLVSIGLAILVNTA